MKKILQTSSKTRFFNFLQVYLFQTLNELFRVNSERNRPFLELSVFQLFRNGMHVKNLSERCLSLNEIDRSTI